MVKQRFSPYPTSSPSTQHVTINPPAYVVPQAGKVFSIQPNGGSHHTLHHSPLPQSPLLPPTHAPLAIPGSSSKCSKSSSKPANGYKGKGRKKQAGLPAGGPTPRKEAIVSTPQASQPTPQPSAQPASPSPPCQPPPLLPPSWQHLPQNLYTKGAAHVMQSLMNAESDEDPEKSRWARISG
jgi:hypothetical protein